MILQLLDLLVGLALTYLIFSMAASAVIELLEARLRRRGSLLESGVREIFARARAPLPASAGPEQRAAREASVDRAVQAFYESASIYPLFRGDYARAAKNLPSYIPAVRFAAALKQLAARPVDDAVGEAARSVLACIDCVAAEAPADPAQPNAIARYFDENMERVSGWYRRHVQASLLIVGFGLAAVFNVDTVHLIRVLSQDSALRSQIVEAAVAHAPELKPETGDCADGGDKDCAAQARQRLDAQLDLSATLGLPIGWTAEATADLAPTWTPPADRPGLLKSVGGFVPAIDRTALALSLLGWFLTALALSQGAPFWFDLLNQLLSARNALKPDTAKPAKAKDDEGKDAAKPAG